MNQELTAHDKQYRKALRDVAQKIKNADYCENCEQNTFPSRCAYHETCAKAVTKMIEGVWEDYLFHRKNKPPIRNFIESISEYLNGEWFSNADWKIIVDKAREGRVLTHTPTSRYFRTNVKDYICNTFGYAYEWYHDEKRNKPARYRFVKIASESTLGSGDEE